MIESSYVAKRGEVGKTACSLPTSPKPVSIDTAAQSGRKVADPLQAAERRLSSASLSMVSTGKLDEASGKSSNKKKSSSSSGSRNAGYGTGDTSDMNSQNSIIMTRSTPPLFGSIAAEFEAVAGSNKEHRNASNVVASSPSVLPNFSSYGQEQQPLQSFGGPTHGQHGKSHSSPFPHLQQQHLHQVYYGHPTQQMIYRHPPPAPPIMSQATPSSSSYPSHVGHLPYPHQFHHSHLKQQLMSGSPSKQQRHNSKRGQAQQQQMICSRGAHMLPSHSVPSHRQETQKWLSPPKVPLLRRTSTQELKVLSVRSANKDNILIAEQQTPQSGVQLDSDLRTDSPCEIESMYFNNKENQLHTNNITATNSSSAKKRLVEMINEENRSLSFDSPRDKSSKKVDGRRTIKQLAKSSASSSTTPASFSNDRYFPRSSPLSNLSDSFSPCQGIHDTPHSEEKHILGSSYRTFTDAQSTKKGNVDVNNTNLVFSPMVPLSIKNEKATPTVSQLNASPDSATSELPFDGTSDKEMEDDEDSNDDEDPPSPFSKFLGGLSSPTHEGSQGGDRETSPVRSAVTSSSSSRSSVGLLATLKRNESQGTCESAPEFQDRPRSIPKKYRISPPMIRLKLGEIGPGISETRKAIANFNKAVRASPLENRRSSPAIIPSPCMPPGVSNISPSPFSQSCPPFDRQQMGANFKGRTTSTASCEPSFASAKVPPSLAAVGSFAKMSTIPPMVANIPAFAMSNITPNIKSGGRVGEATVGENEGETPKTHKENPCNCKKSKCLKLYCECFAAERYCVGCNCKECNNNSDFEPVRSDAIKATRTKNPNAFKPRFEHKQNSATSKVTCNPSTGHNMGCRCKKSACLKKYCECFEAGVMCGDKCKCVECSNFVGSQALIDRRRKIKDTKGAEMALRSANSAWKNGRQVDLNQGAQRKAQVGTQKLQPSSSPNQIMGMNHMHQQMPHMMNHFNVRMQMNRAQLGNTALPGAYPFMQPHMMGGTPGPMGYAIHPVTPAFLHRYQMDGKNLHKVSNPARLLTDSRTTPMPLTPHTPAHMTAVRLHFDLATVKKGSNTREGTGIEVTIQAFGDNSTEVPRATVLRVLSFLRNDELYNASLVNRMWCSLALDKSHWSAFTYKHK